MTLVRFVGVELPDPARISFTRRVPAAVPSDFQSSAPTPVPVVPSFATKNIVPFTSVIHGCVFDTPFVDHDHIFFTRTVPAVVPSDFQSSCPFVPSLAEKNNVQLLFTTSPVPLDPVDQGLMSFINVVPQLVPSDFQSSPFAVVPLPDNAKK